MLLPPGKNFWVGVEGRGVSTGVLSVAVLVVPPPMPPPRPGLRYSSATMTISLPPIADDRFRISSFSSCKKRGKLRFLV
jgi:hypothetical protein